jgi:thymidylate kinase
VIAIGGMDRAGKSIQRRLLVEELARSGFEPVCRWSRMGYTRRLKSGKRWLRRLRGRGGREGGEPRTYPQRASRLRSPAKRWLWMTVALLDLFWEYAVVVRRLRARGFAVVCDRWLCDAVVDLRVNFPQDRVEERLLWRLLARCAVRPDAAFLLRGSPEESLRRARASGRRHVEPAEVLGARLAEYRRLAAAGAGEAIDAERDPEAIAKELRGRLEARLGSGRSPGARREKFSWRRKVAALLRHTSL